MCHKAYNSIYRTWNIFSLYCTFFLTFKNKLAISIHAQVSFSSWEHEFCIIFIAGGKGQAAQQTNQKRKPSKPITDQLTQVYCNVILFRIWVDIWKTKGSWQRLTRAIWIPSLYYTKTLADYNKPLSVWLPCHVNIVWRLSYIARRGAFRMFILHKTWNIPLNIFHQYQKQSLSSLNRHCRWTLSTHLIMWAT